MIVGDLNTTLNPILDRKNYKTGSHKKSRIVINNWITNEEIIDFYRFTNANEQIWTYRVMKFGLMGFLESSELPVTVESIQFLVPS